MATLETNAKTIADAMISFVFNLNSQLCKNALNGTKTECTLQNGAINVDRQRLGAWMSMFATKPRPIVVPQQQLIANLHEVAKRYAHSVQIAEVSVNDFVLYNVIGKSKENDKLSLKNVYVFQRTLSQRILLSLPFLSCYWHQQYALTFMQFTTLQ
jgi:hypothetical protein